MRLIPARPVDFPDTPGFGFPVRFRVEISENAEFTAAAVLADHTASDFKNPGDHPVSFPANKRSARFVRVTATRLWERTSDYVFALAELEVIASGTNVALGATVSALDSIESGSWSKNFLVDGFDSRRKLTDPLAPAQVSDKAKLETEFLALAEKRKQLVEDLTDHATRNALAQVSEQLSQINRELAALPPLTKVYAAANEFKPEGSFLPAKTPRPVHLLARGDVNRPGDYVRCGPRLRPRPGFAVCPGGPEGRRCAPRGAGQMDH